MFYEPEKHVDPGFFYVSLILVLLGGSSKGAVFYEPEKHVDPGFFYDPGHHQSSASSQGNLESVAILYCKFVSLNLMGIKDDPNPLSFP